MKLECSVSSLNLRTGPRGTVFGEMRLGDLFEVPKSEAYEVWVHGTVLTGISAGRTCYARRRHLIEHFDAAPALANVDRSQAGQIVAERTTEFDAVTYHLGSQPRNWQDVRDAGSIDCSGWTYLVGKDVLDSYGKTSAKSLLTYSDEQIANCGKKTSVISGKYLKPEHFQPGVLVGIDFAEYSWDRNRVFDIDHIVTIGKEGNDIFVSQSSSSGGGVNRVPVKKWLDSNATLLKLGRMHLVDLLALP